ncbi:MAG: D-alanyl-D-alanine carboxypeptidase family protein [Leptolyngbyaceae cyanobacterium]
MANFIDDIPEARREALIARAEPAKPSSSFNPIPLLLGVVAILGIGGSAAWWLYSSGLSPSVEIESSEPSTEPSEPVQGETAAAAPPEVTSPEVAPPNDSALLGHRRYEIADASSLVTLSTNAMVRLKPEVAQKIETMMTEARAAGISLDVISGFRSLEDQQYLFFDLKAERGQTAQTRAEVSAPPGYSEHHTGYAVDFVDLSQPATELNTSFENTPAFRWLEENAAYYGFEMSFHKENDQNVAYEPWHWRYVGNQESLELFYQD